ncbi:MAG: hypothetical protein ABIV50_13810 [Opitutus sp.]
MKARLLALLFSAALPGVFGLAGCTTTTSLPTADMVGAWRGGVQFTTGAFAATKDLEFMYVFNSGGTMTESSNYDASPPVPPAYGVWKATDSLHYEANYAFFWTNPPKTFDDLAKGGGWAPGGHGILTQKIALSADGKSFESTLKLELFDQQGKLTEPASDATAKAARISF